MYVVYGILLLSVVPVQGILTTAQKGLFEANDWAIAEVESDYLFLHTGVVNTANFVVGQFPNSDNPNSIQAQDYRIRVPRNPTPAASPGCTFGGTIGMAINGAVFFDAHTSAGHDAVTGACAEVFDGCEGHPDQSGTYHYHQIPGCVESSVGMNEPIGIALDGYLIYPNKDETGNTLTRDDLDSCGGRTGTAGDYRYHMTTTYPYILGCFTGSLSSSTQIGNCSNKITCEACTAGPLRGLVISLCLFWKIVVY